MKKISCTLLLFLSAQLIFSQSNQSFTSNGTFTVPAGVTSVTIEVVGAGGNGAGNGGGGGGGGGYAKGFYTVTPSAVLTVNIGTGGGGSAGGSTSVTGLISATGGANGTTISNPNIGGGGAGGAGSGGNIVNRTGGNGGGGYWTYFGGGGGGAGGLTGNGGNGGNTVAYNNTNCLTPGGSGGASGGAPGGGGGKGAGFIDNACNSANPAVAGLLYGGGGGGGNGNSSPAQNGAGGYCNIEYGCVAPAAPVNTSASMTVCSGNTVALSASGNGTITWYANSTGGPTLATGSTFNTSVLTTTITFYAQAETCTTSTQRTAFTVSVAPSPVITLSASPGPYCINQPFTLTASGGVNYMWSNGSFNNTLTMTPQGTVVYPPNVAGFSANGCFNTASITLNANPQPTITIAPITTLCAGQTITFTASGASNYTWSTGPQLPSIPVTVNSATVYTVTGTSTAGCTNTAAITQTVIPNPTVTISGNTVMCVGQTLKLTAGGALTYTWPGIGTATVVNVPPVVNTVYQVTGFNAEGCSSVATISITVNPCTGITETPFKNKILVYPNPSTGVFTIEAEEDMTLYLYSFSGQLLQTADLNKKNNRTIRLETLPKGIYFLKDDKDGYEQRLVTE